jgi:hypothetical protein
LELDLARFFKFFTDAATSSKSLPSLSSGSLGSADLAPESDAAIASAVGRPCVAACQVAHSRID